MDAMLNVLFGVVFHREKGEYESFFDKEYKKWQADKSYDFVGALAEAIRSYGFRIVKPTKRPFGAIVVHANGNMYKIEKTADAGSVSSYGKE